MRHALQTAPERKANNLQRREKATTITISKGIGWWPKCWCWTCWPLETQYLGGSSENLSLVWLLDYSNTRDWTSFFFFFYIFPKIFIGILSLVIAVVYLPPFFWLCVRVHFPLDCVFYNAPTPWALRCAFVPLMDLAWIPCNIYIKFDRTEMTIHFVFFFSF